MDNEKQISAYVSRRTSDRLDFIARETGIKKARLIEDAINSHLDALAAVPSDAVIPTRVTLSDEDFDRLVERLRKPQPTRALIDLMRGR